MWFKMEEILSSSQWIQCDHVWEKSNYATKLNIDILVFKNIYFDYKIMNIQS